MREKIILQDFTVLLVCPSKKWSTIERRVLFDSTYLRNMGCTPVILCVKNSQIDLAAESEDIQRIYIKQQKINMRSNLNKPQCGCGNTSDLNGYCDGSHSNK